MFVAPIENVSVIDDKVVATYKPEISNVQEWVCVVYKLKNVGKIDIICLNVIDNNSRNTILCDVDSVEYYIENGLLNYSECYNHIIRVGETVSLRICYHKDCIVSGIFAASFTIGMEDRNGRYWTQGLFAPKKRYMKHILLNPKNTKKCYGRIKQ